MVAKQVKARETAICGSCGRFVGPYTACPFCGARVGGRVSLKVVKLVAVLLSMGGLVGLWLTARQMSIPLITADAARGSMNMAYVRIEGRVARNISYDPTSGYLAFWVNDGTGEVYVSSYRDVTAELLAHDLIPAPGDAVAVAGTLRIREDWVALTLNTAQHLHLERPAPLEARIGGLTVLDEGLRVSIHGTVRRVLVPYEGLTLITLQDDSGDIVLAVDDTTTSLTGALPELVEGDAMVVTGTVTLYHNEPQIVPASVLDLKVVPAPVEESIPLRSLSALSAANAGGWARVRGHVVAVTGIKGGVKVVLDDGTAQLQVLLWERLHQALSDPGAVDVGAEIEIAGKVIVYQGELEIQPEKPADLIVHVVAAEVPWVTTASLSVQDVGRVVRLRGVTGVPTVFSAGLKLPLDDGLGTVTVLLWSNVAESLPAAPEAGMMVEVVGEVSVFRDALEIIPRSVYDWRPGE